MRVIITNSQLYNGGDAAIICGIIKVLTDEFGNDVNITIFDPNAEGARRRYPSLNIEQMTWFTYYKRHTILKSLLTRLNYRMNRLRFRFTPALLTNYERFVLNLYREADLIISTGGTYLVENYDIRPRLLELYISIISKTPLILFTQSLGPFRKLKNRVAIRAVCTVARLILLRDRKSRDNLVDLGVNPDRLFISADAAFALANPVALAAASIAQTKIRRVAISVRSWSHFASKTPEKGMLDYANAISNAVSWIVQSLGAEVVFLSTCQGIPEYWAKDSEVASQIVTLLSPTVKGSVRVDNEFHTPEQLLTKLRDFDLVVATRMHMAILSLASGVPVVPIAYEFKTEELFANELAMGEWILSIDALSETSISSMLPNFLANLPGLRPGLFASVEKLRRRALEVGPMLRTAGKK